MGVSVCPDSGNSMGMGIPADQGGIQCIWHHRRHDGQQDAFCWHQIYGCRSDCPFRSLTIGGAGSIAAIRASLYETKASYPSTKQYIND